MPLDCMYPSSLEGVHGSVEWHACRSPFASVLGNAASLLSEHIDGVASFRLLHNAASLLIEHINGVASCTVGDQLETAACPILREHLGSTSSFFSFTTRVAWYMSHKERYLPIPSASPVGSGVLRASVSTCV